MKRKSKQIAFLLMVILLLSILLPTCKVFAKEYGNISIGGDVTSIESDGNGTLVTVNFTNGNKVIVTGTDLYPVDYKNEHTFNNQTRYSYNIYVVGDITVTAVPAENYSADLRYQGNLLGVTTQDFTLTETTHIDVDGEFTQANQQQGGEQGQQGGLEDIEFDIKLEDTHINAWINNVVIMDDQDGVLKNEFKGIINQAGEIEEGKTNILRFINCFGDAPVKEYTINSVTYKQGDENVNIDDEGCWSITVPAAEKYTVTGVADQEAEVPRTIIWTNPGYVPTSDQDKDWIQEFCLENGSGFIKAVYDSDGKLVDPKNYVGENSADTGVDDKNFGWAHIKPGSKVVFKFIPECGYQLVGIKVNGYAIDAGELMNEFVFTMPDTNVHFDAEFAKKDSIVKSESNVIKEGSIVLGENSLDGGTAKLTVSNVDVTDDKKEAFNKAAGEYTVKNIFGVDLYQIFYKGKDDENDVWSCKIDELNNEATITLKLDDGINVEDVVIVHNIHDGEEFETIKIESYDASAHTITFKVKTFSNYAIAIKDVETNDLAETIVDAKSPVTGDNIIVFVVLFVLSAIGVTVVVVKNFKKIEKK